MPAHRLPSSSYSRRRRSSCLLHPLPIIKPGLYTPSSSSSTPSLPTLLTRPIAFAPNITPGTYVEPGSDEDLAMLPPNGVFPAMQDGSALLFPPSGASGVSSVSSTGAIVGTAPGTGRKRHPPGKRPSQGYIPRPPNAFMLFRADFVKQRHVPGSIETNHGSLSKIIGNCWRQLPLDEKHYWEQRAKEEKQQHKIKHPDYRFRPVHNKNKGSGKPAGSSGANAALSASTVTVTNGMLNKSKTRPASLSSHSHSSTVSTTLRTSSTTTSAASAAAEEELRCENVAQLLLEGKKGEELARAVRELDERRLVEREALALEIEENNMDRVYTRDTREGGDDGLMEQQHGWSIERSLDDSLSRPSSSHASYSRGASPHPHPYFAMPPGIDSGFGGSFEGFNSAFSNSAFSSNPSNGFSNSNNTPYPANSQYNTGLMLRRPSSVPLPSGDWLASFHNGDCSSALASSSAAVAASMLGGGGYGGAGDLAIGHGGQGHGQGGHFMPISPSPITGISFAAQQLGHAQLGCGASSLLSTPLSSSSASSSSSSASFHNNNGGGGGGGGMGGNGSITANYTHGLLQRRPSSALASFASIDPASFLGHVSSNAFDDSHSHSHSNNNANTNAFDNSYVSFGSSNMNANLNAHMNLNADAHVNEAGAYAHPIPMSMSIPRKSWTYNPLAVMYNSYETMPFLVDMGIENPYAAKRRGQGVGGGGVQQQQQRQRRHCEAENEGERGGEEGEEVVEGQGQGEEEGNETAGEPDYTLFNDGFSFASGPSTSSTSTPPSSRTTNPSPILRSSATSKTLSIDPTLVDWSLVRDVDQGLTSASSGTTCASAGLSAGASVSAGGSSGQGSPEHFGVGDGYEVNLGGGGMMMGGVDPLSRAFAYHPNTNPNHTHTHSMRMSNVNGNVNASEVDPLSMIGGDYSMMDSMDGYGLQHHDMGEMELVGEMAVHAPKPERTPTRVVL